MIEAKTIAEARAEAHAATGSRRVVDVLEEKLALQPDEFAAKLAATFRLAVLRMDELRRLPAVARALAMSLASIIAGSPPARKSACT